MLYLCGLAYWNQNRLDLMRQFYIEMQATEQAYEWPAGPVVRAMTKGLLEIADKDYLSAEQTLRQASDLQLEVPVSVPYGSARLLLAYLYHSWGKPKSALKELAPRPGPSSAARDTGPTACGWFGSHPPVSTRCRAQYPRRICEPARDDADPTAIPQIAICA